MSRLQRGGRQLIDQLLADLADLDGAATDLALIEELLDTMPLRIVKLDPVYVAERHAEIRTLLDDYRRQARAAAEALRRRIRGELEEMLQRNEHNRETASLPDRVRDLEARITQLTADYERRIAALEAERRVVPFRQTGG